MKYVNIYVKHVYAKFRVLFVKFTDKNRTLKYINGSVSLTPLLTMLLWSNFYQNTMYILLVF